MQICICSGCVRLEFGPTRIDKAVLFRLFQVTRFPTEDQLQLRELIAHVKKSYLVKCVNASMALRWKLSWYIDFMMFA